MSVHAVFTMMRRFYRAGGALILAGLLYGGLTYSLDISDSTPTGATAEAFVGLRSEQAEGGEWPTFITPRFFSADAGRTQAIGVGDMDGDGDLDIVDGNQSGGSAVRLNDGQGHFGDDVASVRLFGPAAITLTAVVVGDMDDDDSLDIVVRSDQGQGLVYLNDGHGNFHAGPVDCQAPPARVRCFGPTMPPTTTVALNPSLAIGDVDGDGLFDIVTTAEGHPGRIYLNGRLTNTVTSESDAAYFYTAAAMPSCDALPQNVRCFGADAKHTRSIALGDIDGDGDLDLVTGHFNESDRIYLNDGRGSYRKDAELTFDSRGYTQGVALGDLNGDGRLDIVAAIYRWDAGAKAWQAGFSYCLSAAGAWRQCEPLSPLNGKPGTSLALGDLNSDGALDILLGVNSADTWPQGMFLPQAYFNDGKGAFTTDRVTRFGRVSQTRAVAVADIDGDGTLDAILGNDGTRDAIYLNNGLGRFPETPVGQGIFSIRALAAADVDDDGWPDLIVGANTDRTDWPDGDSAWSRTGPNQVFLNDGRGEFGASRSRPIGDGFGAVQALAAGDLNADHRPDIVVAFADAGSSLSIFSNSMGVLTHSDPLTLASGVRPTSLTLGDLDGDNQLDIVVGAEGQGLVLFNRWSGQFKFITAPFGPPGSASEMVALNDLNGDGKLDIVAASSGKQSLLYLNDGVGGFYTGPLTSTLMGAIDCAHLPANVRCIGGASDAVATTDLALSDVNGDNHPDVVIASPGTGLRVYLNDANGSGAFYSSTLTASTGAVGACGTPLARAYVFGDRTDMYSGLVLADVDGLNGPDILVSVAATKDTQRHPVYLNDGQGCFSAERSRIFGPDRPETASKLLVADFDRDRQPDVIIGGQRNDNNAAYGATRLAVYLNAGAGDLASAPERTCILATGDNEYLDVALSDLDQDGALDIVAANNGPDFIYMNDGTGDFTQRCIRPLGVNLDRTLAVAARDLNGDGSPDIVLGNDGRQMLIYWNDGQGHFSSRAIDCVAPPSNVQCLGEPGDSVASLAIGDLNADEALDILVGRLGRDGRIYLSEPADGQVRFSVTRSHHFGQPADRTWGLALADMNGDGALDVIAANERSQSYIYFNDGMGRLSTAQAIPLGTGDEDFRSVAAGDVNGDGALDVVMGPFYGPTTVFFNDGRNRFPLALAQPLMRSDDRVYDIGLADVTGDNALDIVLGMWHQEYAVYNLGNVVFVNDGQGRFSADSVRRLGRGQGYTRAIAIGDINRDGKLDVVSVNRYNLEEATYRAYRWMPKIIVYPNASHSRRGLSGSNLTLLAGLPDPADNEGTCSLAGRNLGFQEPALHWPQLGIPYRVSDPLSTTIRVIKVHYSLDGGRRFTPATAAAGTITQEISTAPAPAGEKHCFTWALTNDGVFGLWNEVVIRIAAELSVRPHPHGIPGPYLWPYTISSTTPRIRVRGLQVRVRDQEKHGLPDALIYRVLNRQAAGGTVIADPVGRPYRTDQQGYLTGHRQLASDDRLIALWPTSLVTNSLPARTFYPPDMQLHSIAPDSTVIVELAITETLKVGEIAAALAISQPQGANLSLTLTSPAGAAARLITDTARLGTGDRFVWLADAITRTQLVTEEQVSLAILPPAEPLAPLTGRLAEGAWRLTIYNTGVATATLADWALRMKLSPLYYTNLGDAMPSQRVITQTVVQNLIVTETQPLLLFNLDVALEWDARRDTLYLTQLEYDLRRASEFLYRWTSGRVALGRVTVYHDARHPMAADARIPWLDADVRIYASNRLRPYATQGGIVSQPLRDPDQPDIIYAPGQVVMGATWNRYGLAGANLAEDWPRILAHELGHYLLFLDDNYLGFNKVTGLIEAITGCPGAMADPYSEDVKHGYNIFHPQENWDRQCLGTLSNQETGRSDWETITRFYPWLKQPSSPQPAVLPINVTQIAFIAPPDAPTGPEAPVFYLKENNASVSIRPGTNVRAFLLKDDAGLLRDLGTPRLDQVQARGAEQGDKVCVVDQTAQRQGCQTVSEGGEQLALVYDPVYPSVRIWLPTTNTLAISVTHLSTRLTDPYVRLFPASEPASAWISLTAHVVDTSISPTLVYTGRLVFTGPPPAGHLLLRASERWEDPSSGRDVWYSLTDFTLAGELEPNAVDGLAMPDMTAGYGKIYMTAGWAPWQMKAGYARVRMTAGYAKARMTAGYGPLKSRHAPALSSDGQVILYGKDLEFGQGQLVLMQTATEIPQPPRWARPVGHAYWLLTTPATTTFQGASLSFGYLGNEVRPEEERWLRIYRWDGVRWHPLSTTPNPDQDYAVASVTEPGLYALMSSIEIPLERGWNLFGYPVAAGRAVADALEAISGTYSIIYGYDQTSAIDPWQVYAPGMPDWGNDLHDLEFGAGYLIYVSTPITLSLRGAEQLTSTNPITSPIALDIEKISSLGAPAAAYYGLVRVSSSITVTAGLTVSVQVNGRPCGEGRTLSLDGQIHFVAKLAATPDCGAPGRTLTATFRIGDLGMASASLTWDSTRAQEITLTLPTKPAPPAQIPPALCRELVRNGTFEELDGWTLPQTVFSGRIIAGQGRKNTRALLLGLAPGEPPGPRTPAIASAHQTINVPTDATSVRLSFWYRTNLPSDGAVRARVLLLQPGTYRPLAELWRISVGDGTWQQAILDLTRYRKQQVVVYFEASPARSGGISVDEVSIQACQ